MPDPSDADDVPDPDGAPFPPAAAGGPARHRATRAPMIVAAVLACASVFLGVQWLRAADEADDLAAARDDRRAVAFRAAEFGEAYLTYDVGEGGDELQDTIAALSTDAFARDYEDNRAPAIFDLLSDLDTTTEASTTEVFVADVVDGRARAFVVIDVRASSPTDGDIELSNWTFVLDLVEDDGAWLVDAVAPAPQPGLAGGEGDEASDDGAAEPPASSTTAPPDASTTVAP